MMKKLAKLIILVLILNVINAFTHVVFATPYYDLTPKEIVLRGEFYTMYSQSSEERKHNVKLCADKLNNVLIASGEEFSFNQTVGPRTEKQGYKNAKVILNGEFSDGIGGGVCQVSSTLYNALLVSGITVTECHQHTLQVGYVAPSFDAMVNYNYADLRFTNNTKNPMYIKTFADGNIIKISVYGEPNYRKYVRKSVVTETVLSNQEIIIDEKREYPEIKKGERKVISYGRDGIKSEGYILEYDLIGNLLSIKRIRKNSYLPIKTVIIEGTYEDEVIDEDFTLTPDVEDENL